MTYAELLTEFAARGFDYLSATRAGYYIDSAYRVDIATDSDWPWLEATSTGAAPLTVSDLANVESVIDSTQKLKLRPLDRRNLTDDWDTNLATVGSPQWYYQTTSTTINVYPANTTNTLSVRYWKVPVALSAASDTPILPTKYHLLIVDAAVARAYEDDDEFAQAQTAWQSFQVRLNNMRESLLIGQHDEPDDLIVSYAPDSDLVW